VTADLIAQEYDVLAHFTPTAEQRKAFSKAGVAMPDGSFYIRNAADLDNAINAVGRATPNASESDVARRNSVRRHIMKRARVLGLAARIPDTWNADGSLKQSSMLEDFLAHYGVLGMKWGVRNRSRDTSSGRKPGGGSRKATDFAGRHHPSLNAPRPGPASPEAARAAQLHSRARRSGTRTLSNKELQDLVTRLNLERQYSSLTQPQVNAGQKFVKDMGKDLAKQSAQELIKKYGPKGVKWVAKKAAKQAAVTGAAIAARAAIAAL
jgi:hypothetical protein